MINIQGWNRERGCGRVGPATARAVHSPGRLRDGFASLGRCLSDQSLRGGLAQGSQQTLHDRKCCFLPNCSGWRSVRTTDNGDRGQLWLGREPAMACGSSFDGFLPFEGWSGRKPSPL